jgi:4-oxalocrotonate tautomerase
LPDRAIRLDGSKMARSREDARASTHETALREANRRSKSVPLIQVKLIENVFSPAQKREIIQRLTDTMVEIEGEAMRPVTWVTIEEVRSGEWSIGGKALTTQDVKDLQAS